MSHDNYMAEAEIVLAIKKFQVLRLITFRNYSTTQEIQKFIAVLEPKTFRECNTHFNESKFQSNQSRWKRKPGKKTRRRVGVEKSLVGGKPAGELSQV